MNDIYLILKWLAMGGYEIILKLVCLFFRMKIQGCVLGHGNCCRRPNNCNVSYNSVEDMFLLNKEVKQTRAMAPANFCWRDV